MTLQVLMCVLGARRITTIKLSPTIDLPVVRRRSGVYGFAIVLRCYTKMEQDRAELRNVLHELRIRFGRRRLFRVADVEGVLREVAIGRISDADLAPRTPEKRP
jgi:hypothetical protein